jgi:adenylyl cyclase-associated protein
MKSSNFYQGITVEAYRGASGAAPPPAPPSPPPPAAAAAATSASSTGGAAAVFAELNRGDEVTKGLRKVDKSEMTHKNPSLRATGPVASSPGSPTCELGYSLSSSVCQFPS